MYAKYPFYNYIKKFPISEIKRKKLINEVDRNEVLHMLENFYKDAWEPVMLDKENFLIDGQHRLEFAMLKGLKYIDVIILDEEVMNNYQPPKEYDVFEDLKNLGII
jgi:hypothetical protein